MLLANIFQPLIDVFGPVLVFFHSIIGGSWGWSIIALTVLVGALLLPLAFKQMHSMQKLQHEDERKVITLPAAAGATSGPLSARQRAVIKWTTGPKLD